MPIFSRLLDFPQGLLARLRNKRRHPRFPVGAAFPLKASLALSGPGKVHQDPALGHDARCRWSGRIGDVSVNGLSIQLPPAAATARGEPTTLHLVLEDHELAIPCAVAHFRAFSSHAVCGVHLEFDDYPTQKAYRQLVEAVMLGACFSPMGRARSQAGFLHRRWRSAGNTLLTEWREPGSRALARFELAIGEHLLRGQSFPPAQEMAYRHHAAKSLPPAVAEESARLCRWVVDNLPKNVPADLRALMTRVARHTPTADRSAWQAPVVTRAPSPGVIKVPLSTWRELPAAPVSSRG